MNHFEPVQPTTQEITLSRDFSLREKSAEGRFTLGFGDDVAFEESFDWPGCRSAEEAQQVVNLWRMATALRLKECLQPNVDPDRVDIVYRGHQNWTGTAVWTLADGLTVTVSVDRDCATLSLAARTARESLRVFQEQLEASNVPMVGRYPEEEGVRPGQHPDWAFLVYGPPTR